MSSEFQNLPPAAQEAVMRTMDAMEPAQTQEEIREMLEGRKTLAEGMALQLERLSTERRREEQHQELSDSVPA